MSDDQYLPASCLLDLLGQPLQRMRVNPSRVARAETPVGWRHANPSKIRHSSLRRHFRENWIAIQTEICPKRRPEEYHIPDLRTVVLQNMHACALSDLFDFIDELRDLLSIELVISQNVDYRSVRKGLQYPFDSVPARVDITREHNDLGVHLVRLERRELQMEIAENVDTHDRIYVEQF